jgi:signal transduction histidine kinase
VARGTEAPPLLRAERRRSSLRLRVVLAVVLVALAPQALVFAWSQLDRNVTGHLWRSVRDASARAAPLAQQIELPQAELSALARASRVRLRVFGPDESTLFDADFDDPSDAFDRIEDFVFGPTSPPVLWELDDEPGPLSLRPEVKLARKDGAYVACHDVAVVLCQAVRAVSLLAGQERLVVARASSRRAVQSVYSLRHQLARLSLVTVPFALILAVYTGRRIVRPIERLRRQALEKANAATSTATLDSDRLDEVGILAEAFNRLLLALEQKRQENEAFVADLVHELKNPVAAVRAAAESLSGGADRERADRLARVLRDSSVKLDRVVTQFLELARAEAGLPNEERTIQDVMALLTGLIESLRDDARHARVTFTVEQDGPGTMQVRAVSHRLDALFRELLENAGSFSGDGGLVSVRVTASTEDVVVTVTDTGPGIAPQDLPRVFTRFFTTRGRARGTGLGLALVRAVAEAHGGSVTVQSSPGAGAAFEVRLPRAR